MTNEMIFSLDAETLSCLLAPRVLRIYPATDASPLFYGENGSQAACLDVEVGDSGDPILHVAVGMPLAEVRKFIENAHIIRRPLLLWLDQPIPCCVHNTTGKLVHIGSIDRLGTRGSASA